MTRALARARDAAVIAAVAALTAGGCRAGAGAAASAKAAPPALAGVRVSSDPLDGRALLQEDATRAVAAGAGPFVIVATEVASESDRLGGFVEIPENECALLLARASPTVLDLDLFAYEDEGATFAADESPDPEPTVLVCPPHPRRVYAAARVVSGAGIVAVGAAPVPRTAAAAVSAASRARGRGDDSGRLASWPGLEAKVAEHRASLGGRWEDVKRAVVPVDSRVATRVSLPVAAGRCLDVLVTPSDEIASLEVLAEDASARVVARGRDRARDRSLVLCSQAATEITLSLRARASQGLAAVVAGRSRVGGEAEIADATVVDRVTQTLDLAPARAALARALAGPELAAPSTVGAGVARIGARESLSVDLAAGCSRLDVIAGKPLGGVAAELWDERGARLASGRGGAGATLFACGPGGRARLDLDAVAEPGPFAVELRRARAAPAVLVAHPTAASRLLARVAAARGLPSFAAAGAAEVVTLDDSTLKTIPLSIPTGSCVEVVVALGDGGVGLDMRLLDGVSTDGAFARARHVVSDRVCAPAAGDEAARRAGAVELRLASGRADALVLTRSVSIAE